MTRRIALCLCPGFPLYSVAAALDVMRHANRFATTDYYRWTFLSENDQPVTETLTASHCLPAVTLQARAPSTSRLSLPVSMPARSNSPGSAPG